MQLNKQAFLAVGNVPGVRKALRKFHSAPAASNVDRVDIWSCVNFRYNHQDLLRVESITHLFDLLLTVSFHIVVALRASSKVNPLQFFYHQNYCIPYLVNYSNCSACYSHVSYLSIFHYIPLFCNVTITLSQSSRCHSTALASVSLFLPCVPMQAHTQFCGMLWHQSKWVLTFKITMFCFIPMMRHNFCRRRHLDRDTPLKKPAAFEMWRKQIFVQLIQLHIWLISL